MERDRKIIAEHIYKQGVLPLMSHPDMDTCLRLIRASYKAGVRIIEFACRNDNAREVFERIMEYAAKELPGFIVGVGTIIKKADAEKYAELGAAFIVAPIIDTGVGSYCSSKNIFWCPGAATLTEIVHAHELGADLVKIFPAETLGGPAFVKAIKAPCPWVKLMPTGGVTVEESNLRDWFNAGADCLGIGSALFNKQIVSSASEEEMTAHIAGLLSNVRKARTAA
jgi:2-dehydro-3-deoxyphosphogluconate aldolase/(4S)-4-hydroxy-2-oxoglutarate aldolase